MFVSPSDIAFQIGAVSVYYYGIIMAVAIIVGIIVSQKIATRFFAELPADIIIDVALPAVIGGILGARIYYCIMAWAYYSQHPLNMLFLWEGGLSIHGAIIGGLIAVIIYAKVVKISALKLCDVLSFGLILGQAIGRWGNFFNSEAFGAPTNVWWKLYIPYYQRPLGYENFQYYHPTFLYESIANLLIFAVLFFVLKRGKNRSGTIFVLYLILYSVVRFFIENVRMDSVLNVFSIPIAQIVCVLTVIVATVLLIKINMQKD